MNCEGGEKREEEKTIPTKSPVNFKILKLFIDFVELQNVIVLETESLCLYYMSNVVQERAFI